MDVQAFREEPKWSFRRFGAALTILCGRGAEDKRKATGSILDHCVLQVESFERNVAACAVGADVFKIAVGDPVGGHGVAGAIVQHQQEDSLAYSPVFGRCAERGSGAHRRIPFCCVVIRWIGSRRDRGHFRLRGALGIEVITEIKRVSAEAEARIKRIEGTVEGKQRQEWFEKTDLGHAVEEASGGRKKPKAVEEETVMRAFGRRNERNPAVGAEWESRRRPEERCRNPRNGWLAGRRGGLPQV